MERSHNDEDYLFHDFSTGGADEPLPDIFQSIFSQAEIPTSDYDFKDYDAEPYVGNNDFEDINPFVREDEYAEPEDDSETFYESPVSDDIYDDSGEFRTYDGNHEYRSFDASLPEASPEDWYHYSDEDRELDHYNGEYDDEYAPEASKDRHRGLKIFGNALLAIITVFSLVYMIALYSNISFIAKLRTTYIQTAMETLNHKWMATAIIPGDIIDEVLMKKYTITDSMEGVNSEWGIVVNPLPSFSTTVTATPEPVETLEASAAEPVATYDEKYGSEEEEVFFSLFHELDFDSMHDYLDDHPGVLDSGWSNIDINESGLEDEGTDIITTQGDQVLAINAKNGILLIRLEIPGSRGVLAICKNTNQVSLCPASTLGIVGQTVGRICDANNGILAITGSAFIDPDGAGNGGTLSGLMVSSGTTYGSPLGSGYKRLELRNDGRMYVVDSSSPVNSETRDASEFMPAVIIDGEIIVGSEWNGFNPRAVLGQSSRLETMMVVMEGRFADAPGCGVEDIAKEMKRYDCVQAMNLDGGTSAIMYYDGQYVTRCSNTALPGGRTLPSAWVCHYAD